MDHSDNKITEQNIDKVITVYQDMKSIDTESSYNDFLSRVRANQRKRRMRRYYISSAAAIVLLVVGGWFFYSSRGHETTPVAKLSGGVTLSFSDGLEIDLGDKQSAGDIAQYSDVIIRSGENGGVEYVRKDAATANAETVTYSTLDVSRGSQFDIVLEDGTRVWLNSNSRLRFPNSFADDERRVQLEGEAYFDVAENPEKPFVVVTTEQILKVLGTEFNLYAYPEEEAVYTTLVEGSVLVKVTGGSAEAVLKPGQQSQLFVGGESFTVEHVDAREVSAWRNGMFIFYDNTLGMVFNKLSRWYDFEYAFDDPHTADIIVMGNIPMNLEFDEVISLINDLKIADIKAKAHFVTIKAKKEQQQ